MIELTFKDFTNYSMKKLDIMSYTSIGRRVG